MKSASDGGVHVGGVDGVIHGAGTRIAIDGDHCVYGAVILDESPLRAGDVLLIDWVAARDPVVVEMAARCGSGGS